MQIVCPQCGSFYEVADAAMGGGRMVRCATCRHVWLAAAAEAPKSLAELVAAHDAARAFDAAWPEPTANAGHALSGREGATPPPGGGGRPAFDSNFADSEPIGGPGALENAPPLLPEGEVPPDQEAAYAEAIKGDLSEPDDFAAGPLRPRRSAKRRAIARPSWPTIILSVLTVLAAILAWRAEVVRAMPQTASLFARIGLPVNLRGIAFTDVRLLTESSEDVSVLVVHGAVANVTKRRVEVPRLRFAMRDASGVEVYAWTALPERAFLGPGETQEFRSRLASPPAEAQDVLVRFFTRRDR